MRCYLPESKCVASVMMARDLESRPPHISTVMNKRQRRIATLSRPFPVGMCGVEAEAKHSKSIERVEVYWWKVHFSFVLNLLLSIH